jgi:hypothetical protein
MKAYKMTERESVLLDWIVYLIDLVNRYSVFFGLINRDVAWLDNMWEKDEIKSKQDELLDFLQDTYGMSFTKTTNVEVLKDNEK